MINHRFIGELEGSSLTGYVPDSGASKSGVTIAGGYDLGQRGVSDLSSFSRDLQLKLGAYLGVTGQSAVDLLSKLPLKITQEECDTITEYSHEEATRRLLDLWPIDAIPFGALSDECQTVVASVAYQYGNLAVNTPNFWMQVTTDDWEGALKNLRNFGDRYPTRRNKEADLLEARLDQY